MPHLLIDRAPCNTSEHLPYCLPHTCRKESILLYPLPIYAGIFYTAAWFDPHPIEYGKLALLTAGQGPLNSFLKLIAVGELEDPLANAEAGGQEKGTSSETIETSAEYYVKLLICIVGLQASYLTWGVLQVSLFMGLSILVHVQGLTVALSCTKMIDNYCIQFQETPLVEYFLNCCSGHLFIVSEASHSTIEIRDMAI